MTFSGSILLVPQILDNPRTGVSRACRYDPDLNPTYQEMAMHYGIGVVPARPYRPRDKAKVGFVISAGKSQKIGRNRIDKYISIDSGTVGFHNMTDDPSRRSRFFLASCCFLTGFAARAGS